MKKVALIFLIAVFVPSLLLAWLAVRSLQDQEFVLERQQTLISQGIADRLARQSDEKLVELQREFVRSVETLLVDRAPKEVADTFDAAIRVSWPTAEVGFVVSLGGELLCPQPGARPEAERFRAENILFLCNVAPAQVFWNNYKAIATQAEDRSTTEGGYRLQNLVRNIEQQAYVQQTSEASQPVVQSSAAVSKVAYAEAGFHQLIGDDTEGTMARFLQNRLHVMTWYRPVADPFLVFGAQLDLDVIRAALKTVVEEAESLDPEDIVVAILNDYAQPVAVSRAGFSTDWRRPFVAAEIGDALPHWEVAVYLLDPGVFTQSASRLRITLGLLVLLLILAIGAGGTLLVRDLRRELATARRKTDFVSLVSHELKTPLTSIRMFSELLADDSLRDEAKRRSYVGIISAETARLTRLINQVLDFSRLERGGKPYDRLRCDLVEIVRRTLANVGPQLERAGFRLRCELPEERVEINADSDAISQILLNLLSNAEKYGAAETREICMRLVVKGPPDRVARIHVLDRGPGVPRAEGEKIFEKFYRVDDSLAGGVQGSGLGLTLARQIARAHGGDVICRNRNRGGACFTLSIPLAP